MKYTEAINLYLVYKSKTDQKICIASSDTISKWVINHPISYRIPLVQVAVASLDWLLLIYIVELRIYRLTLLSFYYLSPRLHPLGLTFRFQPPLLKGVGSRMYFLQQTYRYIRILWYINKIPIWSRTNLVRIWCSSDTDDSRL